MIATLLSLNFLKLCISVFGIKWMMFISKGYKNMFKTHFANLWSLVDRNYLIILHNCGYSVLMFKKKKRSEYYSTKELNYSRCSAPSPLCAPLLMNRVQCLYKHLHVVDISLHNVFH